MTRQSWKTEVTRESSRSSCDLKKLTGRVIPVETLSVGQQ